MIGLQQIIRRLLGLDGKRPTAKLDKRLAAMEQVFQAPPLTDELVDAINLISPNRGFIKDEKSRAIWQADQNGACWGEYEGLAEVFGAMARPKRILEIGPGMGRSLVFFSKKLGWQDAEVHAYEGQGTTTKYTNMGPRFQDSFCGNIDMLRYVLKYNGIDNVTILNAQEHQIAELPGPYDLLYSFYAIGFHWSLEHFLDDLLPLLHDKSIALFTVPNEFTPFLKLEDLSYRILDWKTVWPKGGKLKMLVLSKTSLS